ncbi:hypothetical protein RIR_jg7653.t1 [Rhizophagus irregularis DAOM 181602=DAOM 197198]|nr:hypothetical protein RIR_jg7653.t1 [Rhizophagus irregularis DAOM 181602=DAOM 197198]
MNGVKYTTVTSETIYNYLSKTGILPISPSPSPLPSLLPSSSDEEQNDDGLNEIEEIQIKFILIDNDNNYGGEEITDEEIVNTVKL